jgi:hypothetical protein
MKYCLKSRICVSNVERKLLAIPYTDKIVFKLDARKSILIELMLLTVIVRD